MGDIQYQSVLTSAASDQELPDDDIYEKAAVLVDDAVRGVYIERNLEAKGALRAYQWQKSLFWVRMLANIVYVLLAFVEVPSWCLVTNNCGDPSVMLVMGLPVLPRLVTEVTEVGILLFYIIWIFLRFVSIGRLDFLKMRRFSEAPQVVFVSLAFIDVLCGAINTVGIIPGSFRLCRWLRPVILVSMYPRLRLVFRNVLFIISRIGDIILLLLIIIAFGAWFGILVFLPDTTEGKAYFGDYIEGLTSLFIAATTSNHPDVMLPAYTENRVAALFFVVYMILSTFLVMNLLLAAVYDSYRRAIQMTLKEQFTSRADGIKQAFHLLDHDNSGYLRYSDWEALYNHIRPGDIGHARMLFEALDQAGNGVISEDEFVSICSVLVLRKRGKKYSNHANHAAMPGRSGSLMVMRQRTMSAIRTVKYSRSWRIVQKIVNSTAFEYAIDGVIVLNAVFMIVESAVEFESPATHLFLEGSEVVFTLLYAIEMTLKHVVWGFRKYWRSFHNVFDGIVTIVALVTEVFIWIPNEFSDTHVVRIILLTRMLRLIRLLARRRNFQIIFRVIAKLVPAIINTLLVLGCFFYLFAMIGVQLFGGLLYIGNPTLSGTSYEIESGGYFALNFNDFGSALVTQFALMVVNNWFVLMDGVVSATETRWSRLFFVSFYLICVVVMLNLLISFVLEHFVHQWELYKTDDADSGREAASEAVTAREKLLVQLFGDDFLEDEDTEENQEL